MGKPHKKLLVWQRSLALVKQIYEETSGFPAEEKFGLVTQMRRAAISIPSNIAEGSARNTSKEFMNFLHIAQGSVAELETQILISQSLGFTTDDDMHPILNELEEISRMIIGLQKTLRGEK